MWLSEWGDNWHGFCEGPIGTNWPDMPRRVPTSGTRHGTRPGGAHEAGKSRPGRSEETDDQIEKVGHSGLGSRVPSSLSLRDQDPSHRCVPDSVLLHEYLAGKPRVSLCCLGVFCNLVLGMTLRPL